MPIKSLEIKCDDRKRSRDWKRKIREQAGEKRRKDTEI